MEIEIKCLECSKRTRHFEIGPAVFTMDGDREILLKNNIVCPKCKRDISNGKCITPSGMFLMSLMALTICLMEEKEGGVKVPPHLRGMAIVTKEDYDALTTQNKASIKLADKL